MAFTSKTFNLLRDTVKESMEIDKNAGLPTGYIYKKELSQGRRLMNIKEDLRFFIRCHNTSYTLMDVLVDKNDTIMVDCADGKKRKVSKWAKTLSSNVTDEDVKQLMNKLTNHIKPFYIYFTSQRIQTHYRVLSAKLRHQSCMSKPAHHYGQIRPDTEFEDPSWVRYIHPCEAYNDSPNLRLMLVSHYAPDDEKFNDPDFYPFIARAIVKIEGIYPTYFGSTTPHTPLKNGEPHSGTLTYACAYGNESVLRWDWSMLTSIDGDSHCCIVNDSEEHSMVGGLLKVQREWDYEQIVAPYVDSTNRLYQLDDEYLCIAKSDVHDTFAIYYDTGVIDEDEVDDWSESIWECIEYSQERFTPPTLTVKIGVAHG